jgi:hypothetical protein
MIYILSFQKSNLYNKEPAKVFVLEGNDLTIAFCTVNFAYSCLLKLKAFFKN